MPETLQKLLEQLTGGARGPGRLQEPATRGAIPQDVVEGVPEAAATSGGGITSPLVEQAYAGAVFYSLTSSDGLIVFEFGDETEYIDNDGNGNTITVKHRDPAAP